MLESYVTTLRWSHIYMLLAYSISASRTYSCHEGDGDVLHVMPQIQIRANNDQKNAHYTKISDAIRFYGLIDFTGTFQKASNIALLVPCCHPAISGWPFPCEQVVIE